ncbi:MAG: dipeptidyl-peptidase 3 family protein, partial [Bacteroidales bacterium]
MKHVYFLLFTFAIIILGSCSRDYPFTNDTFYGDHVSLTIPSIENADEISLNFEGSRLFINGESFPWEIIEETEQYYLIRADIEGSEETQYLDFRYLKTEGDLILIDSKNSQTIRLMTQERIFENKLNSFSSVNLSSDISHLSDNQKEMLKILFQVADIMNELFWIEAYGDKEQLMETTEDETLKKLFKINYGPWERLNNDKPFLPRYGEKYPGANFYPSDMTIEEFEAFEDPLKTSLYTLIRRDDEGNLKSIWYHEAFTEQVSRASELLREAAELADDKGFKIYLEKRAEALLTDEYYESDVAWMKMKNNDIDFVVGPIENYEDKLFNYKAAHESFILIKDREWSDKLSKLAELLPMLQRELPVPERFKQEVPGTGSDLNVYDAIYYA